MFGLLITSRNVAFFSDCQYGFRSCRPTVYLVTVVSDRITIDFGKSMATRAAALDIANAFSRD